jgi:hypothetical protein
MYEIREPNKRRGTLPIALTVLFHFASRFFKLELQKLASDNQQKEQPE